MCLLIVFKMSRKLLVVGLFVLMSVNVYGLESAADVGSVRACYYRIPGVKNYIELPESLCSHVIISNYEVTSDGSIFAPVTLFNTQTEGDAKGSTSDILKTVDTNIAPKFLLGIGKWSNSGSMHAIHNMINNDTSRANFVNNAISILSEGRFVGLDFLYDYTINPDYVATDKENFVLLLSELREAFGAEDRILTASVSANLTDIEANYNVTGLTENLDYIFLHAHDYYGKWTNVTAPNAPGYFINNYEPFNVNASIAQWIDSGVPTSKLVLGVTSAANTFTLSDPNNTATGAPVTGPGKAGIYTKKAGLMGYFEVCDTLGYSYSDVDNGQKVIDDGNIGVSVIDVDTGKIVTDGGTIAENGNDMYNSKKDIENGTISDSGIDIDTSEIVINNETISDNGSDVDNNENVIDNGTISNSGNDVDEGEKGIDEGKLADSDSDVDEGENVIDNGTISDSGSDVDEGEKGIDDGKLADSDSNVDKGENVIDNGTISDSGSDVDTGGSIDDANVIVDNADYDNEVDNTVAENSNDDWTVTEVSNSYAYANKGLEWIGFDSEKTMYAKGKLAREWKLAGIYMWSLDMDDSSGTCGTRYPLLKNVISGFNSV